MDEEARQQLIAQATIQHAREQIQHARTNMPYGVVLVVLGAGLALAAGVLPLPLIGMTIIGGLGLLLIPCGLAVLIRAGVTISRSQRQLRAAAMPAAKVVR
jgi:hypothetical protein